MNIIFFGSTSDSTIVLEKLFQYSAIQQYNNITISCVVTQPPTPVGRKQVVTPTPVEVWAKEHDIPVLSFPSDKDKPWLYKDEQAVINSLSTFKPDLLISACYGQKIPQEIITESKCGGLNVHPSLLPRWRGADPVPWTILAGDRQTGVTVITLSEKFDQGKIISQKKIPVVESDSTDPLRTKLFSLGADLLIESLFDYISEKNKGKNQNLENATYARRFTRDDGFIPWKIIQTAREGLLTIQQCNNITILEYPSKQHVLIPQNLPISSWILRMLHAFSPWPGVWSEIDINPTNQPRRQAGPTNLPMNRIKKRLKIIQAHVENKNLILDTVQLEGKKPVSWIEFKKAYLK